MQNGRDGLPQRLGSQRILIDHPADAEAPDAARIDVLVRTERDDNERYRGVVTTTGVWLMAIGFAVISKRSFRDQQSNDIPPM